MKNVHFAISTCLILAVVSVYFAAQALISQQISSLIVGIGMTFIFIWYALNAEMLVSRIPIKKLISSNSIEHSKGRYLAYAAILSIPIAFAVQLLEWL